MKKTSLLISRFFSDGLLRHSSIVFAAMLVAHVSNMIFQMAVSRALPVEEYALLAAFLGILTIIQRPVATLRTGLSYYSRLLYQDGHEGDVKRLLRKWMIVTGGPALLLCAATILFSEELAAFLHLQRREPVLIAGIVLPALFWLPILSGTLQGLQRFGLRAVSTIMGAVVRLLLGAGFVWFLYPACGWAMLGHGLGLYVNLTMLFLGLVLILRGKPDSGTPLPSMRNYLFQSFFIQAAYVFLMTADVILVKHYIPHDTEFAYAATLGRMVVFLPGAIVMAMFPKVTSRGTLSNEQRSVFIRSFVFTAAFVLVAMFGCFIMPGLLAKILFGITDASPYLRQMIGLMAVVMSFSALLNVIIQFLLAQHRFAGLSGVVLMAVMYSVGAHFSSSSVQIIAWGGTANLLALVWAGVIAFRHLSKVGEKQ